MSTTGDTTRGDAWNPTQYNRFQAERTQPFRDLQAMIAPQVDMEIVDLGCGTGELTRELHRHFRARHTLGIDNSPNMLAEATRHAGDGVTFQLGDLGAVEFPEAFDLRRSI
jgi:trans-aconitate 2-methyltransferase